jgi:hypothetical protein
MDKPGVKAGRSVKDIIAHLTVWNNWLVIRIRAAHLKESKPRPPWPEPLEYPDEINDWIYEAYRRASVREVLDDMRLIYQQLLAVIKELPDEVRIERDEPAYYVVWVNDKTYLASEFFNHFHNDYEPNIRSWLAREENH